MNNTRNESGSFTFASHYSAKQNNHHVNFFCHAPGAAQVSLVGDFNQWERGTCPMRRMADGCWTASLELPHGYHQYLFIVDGKPVLDPHSAGTARDESNAPVSLVAVS